MQDQMFTPCPFARPLIAIEPYCSLWIDGKPKATPRTKAFRRGKHTGVFTPNTADDWKALVAIAIRPFLPETPITDPVVLNITLLFPRPARLNRKKDFKGMIPMDKKPDRDNSEKAICDMLTDIGMWRDDSLVFAGPVEKWYHAQGGKPGAYIEIGVYV